MRGMDADVFQGESYVFSLRNVEGIWNLFFRSELISRGVEMLPGVV